MKHGIKVLMVIGLLGATSAFAHGNWFNPKLPGPDDSWDTILANRNVQVLQVGDGPLFPNGFFSSCVDGDYIRSLTKETVCVASHTEGGGQEQGGSQSVCDKTGPGDYVYLPITTTVKTCLEWAPIPGSYESNGGEGGGGGLQYNCVNWQSKQVSLPLNPEMSVVTTRRAGGQESGFEEESTLLFKKTFQIPACK